MFEWDRKKDAANLKKHGICFDEAKEIFNGPVLTRRDNRRDYVRSVISVSALWTM
jgi:uncharacterized DUF497 family protein